MEIKQQLRLSQQLVMTPQLQQAIKLLQMSRIELVDMVREELLENPILEDQIEGVEHREAQRIAVEERKRETSTIDQQVARDDKDASQTDKKSEDIDWERYLENHVMQAPMPSFRGGGDGDDLPGLEATLSNSENLVQHILWQLRMSDFVDEELRFAALVVGHLNDEGFLSVEGLSEEEIVPRLAREAGLHPEDAEEVLSIMQHFEPIGVCCRSLKESLIVQARHCDADELVIEILKNHLKNLERKNYSAISRELSVELEEVYDVAQFIADLDPRPGRNYAGPEPQYITPDVYVHRVGDDYFVVANDDGMPKLKISGFYRAAMTGDPKAKEYIQGKLRSAQWLIQSIDQRRKTIVKVTKCIVEKQQDFFDKGIEHLRPMILRDIAESVGMHESTISRVTSNKYVATPRGLFELKFFFNSAIRRKNKEDIASESVKQAIKKIVGGEDESSPFSDQKIVEILAQDQIKIARRTVAKYREMLGILSSSKRKKYF
ncbi:MAG: RNA polymerase factor sigma-54 [Myxococcota bacterium]